MGKIVECLAIDAVYTLSAFRHYKETTGWYRLFAFDADSELGIVYPFKRTTKH